MYSCRHCLREFSRYSNCLRHEVSQHNRESYLDGGNSDKNLEANIGEQSEEDQMDLSVDAENEVTEEEDAGLESDGSGEEDSGTSTDTGSGSDEDEDDEDEDDEDPLWEEFIESAVTRHADEYESEVEERMTDSDSLSTAKDRAFNNLIPTYQKSLRQVYLDAVQLQQKLKTDPIHKKILATKRKLEEEDNFSPKEAWEYAVKKRKYLLSNLIQPRDLAEDSDDADDDETE